MNDIVHLPSKQAGNIIGYHHNKKQYTVKTESGQVQIWTNYSIKLLKGDYMTNKILMTISGGPNKMYNLIDRVFNNWEDAYEYLNHLVLMNPIKEIDKKGQCATLMNSWSISCNYDIKALLDKKPPNQALMDWFPFDLQKKLTKSEIKRMPDSRKEEDVFTSQMPLAKKPIGKIIKLQDLTKDGRKARVILRQLVRQKKIIKPSRWEWEQGSNELEIIKQALGL